MKTLWDLRNELSKLHDKIAMKDANTPEDENKLDDCCEYILKAMDLLNSIDE